MNSGHRFPPGSETLGVVLADFVAAADWYRRCLEDVQDRRPVRGLGEAKAGYDSALRRAREALEAHRAT